MRGFFEVCLLISFHVFGVFLCMYFVAGISPLLIPPMRTPSRGATCRSRGRISEHRRDPSKALLSGVKCQRHSRAAHKARTASVVTLRRLVVHAFHCGQGLYRHFAMIQFRTLHSIHMHINFELFAAFSYTGSPKAEQGGDNQARHVVSKPLKPEPACQIFDL